MAAEMGTWRAADPDGIFPALGARAGLGHKSELAEPQNKGNARAQHVFKGCRAAAAEEGVLQGLFGGLGTAPASLQLGAGEPAVGLPQWSSNQAAKEGLKPGKVCRGPRAACYFGGMEQLAAAPDGSRHFLWARLQPPPWWAGRGVSRSGCLFIGHCLKCQVHLDALNTCMSH